MAGWLCGLKTAPPPKGRECRISRGCGMLCLPWLSVQLHAYDGS